MIRTLFISALVLVSSILLAQNTAYFDYIDRYKSLAINEMERSGVPASIKLAQGILESAGGTSTLARQGNNHFGIKCGGPSWKGKTIYRKDDDRDENGKLIESCFRKFSSARKCYIAHSEFLRNNKRYDFLFYLNPRDYKSWCYGLKKAGYATSATYAEKLINVIETYELYKLDNMTTLDVLAGTTTSLEFLGVLLNNDVKMVLAKEGQTPGEIAQSTNTRVNSILKYNEKLTDSKQLLAEEERIYIQKKRRSYREKKTYHYVKEGDNMYKISQMYGIRLKRLYKRNRMRYGSQPALNEKIKIRGWKANATLIPKLRGEVPPREEGYRVILPDDDNDGFLDVEDDDGEIVKNPPKTSNSNRTTTTGVNNGNEEAKNSSGSFPLSIGKKKYHDVAEGDDMASIAKMYDVDLGKLYTRNRITTNGQPLVGERIKLRGWKVSKSSIPKLNDEVSSQDNSNDVVTYNEDGSEKPKTPAVTSSGSNENIEDEDLTTEINTPKRSIPFDKNNKYHYVEEGDNMLKIAKMYGVSLKKLHTRNRIPTNAQPAIGERVKLRGWKVRNSKAPLIRRNTPSWAEEIKKDKPIRTTTSGTGPTSTTGTKPTTEVVTFPTPDNIPVTREEVENRPTEEIDVSDETSAQYYMVDNGDTLYSIAKNFGTTVQAIKDLNGLTSNLIKRGMQLRVK